MAGVSIWTTLWLRLCQFGALIIGFFTYELYGIEVWIYVVLALVVLITVEVVIHYRHKAGISKKRYR
jgi:hypothetical protein